MTEAEWLGGQDLTRMLHFVRLYFQNPRSVGDRKLRLFAVACCRLIAHALSDPRSREAVEVAERAAEGMAGAEELRAAYARASAAADAFGMRTKTAGSPSRVAQFAAEAVPIAAAKRVANWIGGALVTAEAPAGTRWPDDAAGQMNVLRGIASDAVYQARVAAAQAMIPMLLRDVCGNPFRPVVADQEWLAWNDGAVRKLALAINDDRAFDRLPVLADALEDAGCTAPDLLGHLRGPGPHTRGCWALDLLLEKQ
jgi:hypothetical protein